MNGGLLKSTSRLALIAAAGLFAGGVAMPSAKAADLGGDCCADLEERVAELEATTARKGNRRMSLTITGQVNKTIQYWDDNFNHGVRIGLDNTNSSSRFSFLGEAKVTGSLKIGFEIMLETEGPNTTSRQSQTNEDGSFSGTTYAGFSSFNNGTANAGNSDSFFGDARRAAFWIEHKDAGRVTLGRYESAGVVTTIDLGGISVIASSSVALLHGNFSMRTNDGGITAAVWSSFLDPAAAQGRTEVLRYDSPTIAGFVFSASLNEELSSFQDAAYWGTMLRWAGEYGGFRMAAGIGYEAWSDRWISASLSPGCALPLVTGAQPACPATIVANNGLIPNLPVAGGGTGQSGNSTRRPDGNAWGFSLAGLHVPSGLFLQGEYMAVDYNNAGSTTTAYWGETCGASTSGGTSVRTVGAATAPGTLNSNCNPKSDAWMWQIQAGISKNWFGLGNTALYGEYSKMNNWGAEDAGRSWANAATAPQANGITNVYGVTSTEVTVWGLGMVQNIDAAATELYLGWRRFDIDTNVGTTCTAGTPGGTIGNTGKAAFPASAAYACSFEGFDIVTAGARVKF